MRLAYLVNQYPQPSQTFIRREIAALERAGATVTRYTLRATDGPLVDADDEAERGRTRVVLAVGVVGMFVAMLRALLTRPRRFARSLSMAWRLGRRSDRGRLTNLVYFAEACVLLAWLRADGAEHLHAHFGTNAAAVALLVRLLGGPPYSFTVHGPEEFDKPLALHLAAKVEHAAFVVAVSQFGRSQLCRWARLVDWQKLRVVHCGLDDAYLDAAPTPPSDARRLVCVARLHEQKGLFVLVDAAERVRQRSAAFEIVVIGDGPLRSQLEGEIARRSLHEVVQLWGWRDATTIRDALKNSRGFALPSFAEGLPVSMMEALALGRPVISTYIAGIPELVLPGECGWLVPASDAEALADAIDLALDAPRDRLAGMGQNGVARVRTRHDIHKEAAKLLQFFTESAANEQRDE